MIIQFSEIYELTEIGRGRYGVVYRGMYKSKFVALKVYDNSALDVNKILQEYELIG